MSTPTIDDRPLTDDEVSEQLAADEQAAAAADQPAPEPKARPRTRGQRAAGRARSPRKKTTRTRTTSSPKPERGPVDYTAGAQAMVRTIGMGLSLVAQQTDSPALQMDAMTVAMASVPLSKGLAEAAEKVPALASVLTWFAETGPLADLFGVIGQVATQVAANHGAVPAGAFGTLTPEQMAAQWRVFTGDAEPDGGGVSGA